jgi:putative transposase
MIEENSEISISKQAELLSVSKSSHYYEHIYSESELKIMSEIDTIYTDQPYYGSRRISVALENLGYNV